jgi:hypothetical protein
MRLLGLITAAIISLGSMVHRPSHSGAAYRLYPPPRRNSRSLKGRRFWRHLGRRLSGAFSPSVSVMASVEEWETC